MPMAPGAETRQGGLKRRRRNPDNIEVGVELKTCNLYAGGGRPRLNRVNAEQLADWESNPDCSR